MGDLIIFFTFFLPLIAVIGLNSTLYDGWRHLYFIYPSFIIIGVYGINIIKIKFFKKKNILLFLLLIFFSTPTLFWMFKYHPYQNMYFNFFAGKDFNKKFDMDYWGLSNHAALIKIAQNASKKVIVSNIGTTDLHLSRSFLQKEYRDKISLDDRFENADYIINNYRDRNGRINDYESQISSNFEPFYDIKVDGISINTIYKKIK
jgi:hypothetical protein